MKLVQNETLDWLLEREQPSIRHKTLVELLGSSRSDPEVKEALSEISRRGWARDILAGQKQGGYWDSRKDLYHPKYSATIWKLIVLADLGLTANDKRIRLSCEFFLNEYSRPDGGLDTPGSKWARSELCITGNLARTLSLCGYGDDSRVRSAYDWLVEHQMDDGGWHCFYEKAFGRGTLDCWEALSAFAALPRARWTKKIKRSVERGAEFYLRKGLLKEGHSKYAPWFRFHYPVHYYYDALVGLDIITTLGYAADRRLGPALELLKSKRLADGKWALDKIHPDVGKGAGYRFKKEPRRFALEKEGEQSKWITFNALAVLKRVEEQN
ncbi:MAG: prenyltransferase/squalene oxidase repeat-containing protein [Nitrososphaerales archaeon]